MGRSAKAVGDADRVGSVIGTRQPRALCIDPRGLFRSHALVPDTVLLGTRGSPSGSPANPLALLDGSQDRARYDHNDREHNGSREEVVPRESGKGIHL